MLPFQITRPSLKSTMMAFVSTIGLVLALAGCSGTASDAQVASSAPVTDAALAPFAATDCALDQPPIPVQSAPMEGKELDGVVVQLSDRGVPTVTIPANAVPAEALGSLDLVVGDGADVVVGATVEVNYCGIGLSSRTLFDSSWSRGTPAAFPLDPGGLIQGWIDGLPGMKVGGERLLLIPGSLAYGANPPAGAGIAPDETLVFIVQVTAVS